MQIESGRSLLWAFQSHERNTIMRFQLSFVSIIILMSIQMYIVFLFINRRHVFCYRVFFKQYI